MNGKKSERKHDLTVCYAECWVYGISKHKDRESEIEAFQQILQMPNIFGMLSIVQTLKTGLAQTFNEFKYLPTKHTHSEYRVSFIFLVWTIEHLKEWEWENRIIKSSM